MIVIGLTGSIGMGKTTVATMLRQVGISVDNADTVVHRLLAPDGAAYKPVADKFPQAVKNGTIDRALLGNLVFGDERELAKLEAILHPLVKRERQKFLATARRKKAGIVILDIPLLFETGQDATVDLVMTVGAPHFVQHTRVMARKGMTPQKFRFILGRQMPDREKRRRSDIVILTGQSRGATFRQLQAALKRIESGAIVKRKMHARNRSRYGNHRP